MNIAIIHWGCVHHDAISSLVRNHVEWSRASGHDARFVGGANDYADMPHIRASCVADVRHGNLLDRCDVSIFHFGVHYPLFDLLLEPKGNTRRIVFFHNITPKQYVAEESWELIDKSFKQMGNLQYADEVVCVSETNKSVLESHSISCPVSVMPLPISCSTKPLPKKPSFTDGIVRLAFVGRFVKSKGPTDMLEAFERIAEDFADTPLVLTMAGNIGFSNKSVLDEIQFRIARLHKKYTHVRVDFQGDIEEAAKKRMLQEADIFILPTYHEGFCVPVLEALAQGCRVLSYDNSNLPAVSGGLATLIPTGNLASLGMCLKKDIELVRSEVWRARLWHEHVLAAANHLKAFSPERIRQQFLAKIERCEFL